MAPSAGGDDDCRPGHPRRSGHWNGGRCGRSVHPGREPDCLHAPLHALRDGVDGAGDVGAHGFFSVFPNNTYRSSNRWVFTNVR